MRYEDDDTSGRSIQNISKNILEKLSSNKNQKISLEEFLNGTKNNEKLRDILCPSYL